jgi:hypothetical protein
MPANGSELQGSDPVRVKMHMHNDDAGHVTLSRLKSPDDSPKAPSSASRRPPGARRHRRNSSMSSGGLESDAGAPSSSRRYRRNGSRVRPSNAQPFATVPPPPAMSNSALGSTRPPGSELNLPPPPTLPVHGGDFSGGSAMSGNPVGSPGNYGGTDAGTGTDVSAFADNRRRRRAERARRQQQGQRVEFE